MNTNEFFQLADIQHRLNRNTEKVLPHCSYRTRKIIYGSLRVLHQHSWMPVNEVFLPESLPLIHSALLDYAHRKHQLFVIAEIKTPPRPNTRRKVHGKKYRDARKPLDQVQGEDRARARKGKARK